MCKTWTGNEKASYYFEKTWIHVFSIICLVIVFYIHRPFLDAVLDPLRFLLNKFQTNLDFLEPIAWLSFYLLLILNLFCIFRGFLSPYVEDKRDNDNSTGGNGKTNGALQEQYKQTQENQRSLVRLLWELPTLAIALSTGFLVASYNFFGTPTPDNFLLRSGLLFFGWLLMFVIFLAVIKHRHFRGVWLEQLGELERLLGLNPVPMHTDPTKSTNRYKNTRLFHKLFLTFRAEEWLANVIFLISLIFAALAMYNFYQFLIS